VHNSRNERPAFEPLRLLLWGSVAFINIFTCSFAFSMFLETADTVIYYGRSSDGLLGVIMLGPLAILIQLFLWRASEVVMRVAKTSVPRSLRIMSSVIPLLALALFMGSFALALV